MKLQQFYTWQSQLPHLKRSVQSCLKQLITKSIHTRKPFDFESRTSIIKHQLSQQIFDLQNPQHLPIFAYLIQQKVNVSLLQLSKQFQYNFGREMNFWMTKITSIANIISFQNKITIWNVNDFVRQFVQYETSPLQQNYIRQWRLKAQPYLANLVYLINKIQKLKKTDSPFCLDEIYKNFHVQKVLYKTYLLTKNNQFSLQYDEEITMTYQTREKAEKKLFNYQLKKNDGMNRRGYGHDDVGNNFYYGVNVKKNNKNTLENYSFFRQKQNEQRSSLEQLQKMKKKQMEYEEFKKTLQSIGKYKQNIIEIQQLRNLVYQDKQKHRQKIVTQNERFQKQHISYFKQLVIHSQQPVLLQVHHFSHYLQPLDYFRYESFPVVNQSQIIFSQPFKQYNFVDYESKTYELYQELVADEIMSESDGLDSEDENDNENDNQNEDGQSNFILQDDPQNDQKFIDKRFIIPTDNQQINEDDEAVGRMVYENLCRKGKEKRWVVSKNDDNNGGMILGCFMIMPIFDGDSMPYEVGGGNNKGSKKRSLKRGRGNLESVEGIVGGNNQGDKNVKEEGYNQQYDDEETKFYDDKDGNSRMSRMSNVRKQIKQKQHSNSKNNNKNSQIQI